MRLLGELAAPGGFIVGVLRDDDGARLWLGSRHDSREQYGATLIDRRVVGTGGPGWSACGGVLPEGAVRAVVRGATETVSAEGVWLALSPAPHHEPAVRFETADGALVTGPPEGEPVTDATDPCPACERTDWEQADDQVRCRACGHELRTGGFYAYSSDDPPQRRLPRFPRSFDAAARKALRKAPGPVYSVAGAEATVRGYGGRPGKTDQITLATGSISVETSFDEAFETPEQAARNALVSPARSAMEWPPGSHAAMAIRLDAARRTSNELAARAAATSVDIDVDGAPRTFTLVRAGDAWAAATDGIVISGHGPLPAALSSER